MSNFWMTVGHDEGWGIFERDDNGVIQIQKLDEHASDAFESDERAELWVQDQAAAGSWKHIAALEYVRYWSAINAIRYLLSCIEADDTSDLQPVREVIEEARPGPGVRKYRTLPPLRPWNSIERASPGPLTDEQVRQTVEAIRVLLKRAPGATGWVIRLVALANGTRSADEGKYLQDYDAGRGTYIATTEAASAKHFPDLSAVHEYVRQSAGLRPDGKPNRPLTAWTIEVLRD